MAGGLGLSEKNGSSGWEAQPVKMTLAASPQAKIVRLTNFQNNFMSGNPDESTRRINTFV
jgi:hypothetical protein